MSEEKINAIALGADLIVAGFAFSYDKEIGFTPNCQRSCPEKAAALFCFFSLPEEALPIFC